MLLDAAHLQEEDARHANQRRSTRHHPALPLYTTDDAELALSLFRTCEYHEPSDDDLHLLITEDHPTEIAHIVRRYHDRHRCDSAGGQKDLRL
jgi:hypothetical protein